jgi:hypothetical protein
VIEVFINNKYAFASRYYPVSPNSNGVDLFATGNTATANVKIWNMHPASVLPLTWLSFSAQQANKDVQLKWQVANEVNIDHYEVERSSDGRHFQSISTRKATNSSSVYSYDYTDNLPIDGTSYYRIKEVDKNGTVSYSSICKITVAKIDKTGLIQLLQNPAKENLTIRILTDMPEASIALCDAGSKKVYQQKIENMVKNQVQVIPVRGWASGVYLLTVSASGKKETHKVMIQ